ncbi:type II toxin-antitoxin system RelE/ParE family toxin [Azospirillum lipoferum]|uniref:Type II toxin-antitoxin system RelE/ParE family toxin n=1 Tax=Azospirillum lipoferum TaxID=193 RepID=A0A5A9GME0_AZOLI|nr:type II toxin-antitoxin system RelE/ParE family toxin [Azospirillum lipoferum]
MGPRWTRPAARDFNAICDRIAQANPTAAERTGRRLLDAVARLKQLPEIGRPGRVFGTRELVVSGLPYIIVYNDGIRRDNIVTVLRVIHTAMLWPPHVARKL